MIKIEFLAMGCAMTALLDHEDRAAQRALQQVPFWFEEWEQALSRFRPDSDLSRLNGSAGEWFEAEPVLFEVVTAALEASSWTAGLVNPAVLNSLETAGYDRSFELLQARIGETSPTTVGVVSRGEPVSWHEIRLDVSNRRIFLPAGMKVDLGGIAKGWAAAQAAERLSAFGAALVDAGGDIAVSGVDSDGDPWPVAVDDPLGVQQNLEMLAIGHGGVATSGIDYRRWLQGGSWKHHIIDPRTGQPAVTDLMSVTVVAPDMIRAEAAAKAVLILGSREGIDWLDDQPDLAGLLALQDGRVQYSSRMQEYVWSMEHGAEI